MQNENSTKGARVSESSCTCPIRPNMSKQELLEEIYIPQKNCCHPHHICTNLDREMRRAEKEEGWRKYQKKQLKKQGLTDEEIAALPPTRRGKKGMVGKEIELDLDIV